MKKLFIGLFILGLSTQVFAKIKAKDIAGTWEYTVQTDQGDLTGVLNFTKEKKGALSGEVVTDDGTTIPMSKIEIKEGDVLYFEIQPEYDVMQITVNIEGDKFKGVVDTGQGDMTLIGEKKK